MNKATKHLAAARLDHWESAYFCPGSGRRFRRDAKRNARRARRRLDAAMISEAMAD